MKVIICGAGKVGTSIARHLVDQNNDVTVIDQSQDLINNIRDKFDLKSIIGSASNPSILQDAGAESSDMLIAVTLQDEINMVACQMAHTFFKIPRKIARIRSEDFLNPIWRNLYNADNMPIDLIISPELEVAKSISRQIQSPGAYDVAPFIDDSVQLINITINENCPLIDTELKNIHELFQEDTIESKNLRATIIGIERNEKLFIPDKSDKLLDKDTVYLLTDRSHLDRAVSAFGIDENPINKIIIIGGGNIGFNLARELEEINSSISVTIIETSKERSSYIADHLKKTLVLRGDGLDQLILDEANIAEADMILALTNDDETNIITSAIARRNKCKSLILINNSEYSNLKEVLGIDRIIDPRMITASQILKHVHKGKIESVYSISNNQGEVIHAQALKNSKLINVALKDLSIPDGIRIGIICREGKISIPDKDTIIYENDDVVFISLLKSIRKAEDLFQVSEVY